MSQAGLPESIEHQAELQKASERSDKELNFRKQEEGFKRQLDQERQARMQMEQELAQLKKSSAPKVADDDDMDDDDEPYVDKRRLKKELVKVAKQTKSETQSDIQQAVQQALAAERQTNWKKNNPDFYEVMQYAEKFAEKDPELAETILQMPEGFERQKLVYKNIKAFGIHKKEEPKENIQDKIDQNRRSPYYQPSGVGTAPYNSVSIGKDISPIEGKNAYQKMQELKSRLRI